ncbi:piggyBac transposable element-derived protein 4-like [Diabrotica virgifera virgifera]|uniref:PiggyBac transposable element-derived protein domain-containing protein n=1 Tax=Diabrotica virgifera virgifera TaxID=50390 RepID=A0ABM5L765_DIAVI|nr:piggyBac transposable element-derived protein 4-like [Diabrotica virgifera virgifera]
MSYEKEQRRLQSLWDDNMSDDTEDPYYNDSDNDPVYQQESSSTGSSVLTFNEPRKKRRRIEKLELEESEDSEINESSNEEEQDVVSDWGVVVGDPKDFDFDGDIGLVKEVQDMKGEDIFAYYKLFLDDELINTLVTETNLYAEQAIIKAITEETLMPSSRLSKWTNVTCEEMYCFLGFLLWMGLDKKPKITDYWKRSEIYWSEAANRMSRNRFENILRMWHFANNEHCEEGDRLGKIRFLVDSLNKKFKQVIFPDENVCIDETMVPFRGRLIFRQYVKGKRHKFGIKLFKLCLPGGYTYHCKIYCGTEKSNDMLVATKIVFELMGKCLDKGMTLYTDNWYTSTELAQKLLERKTHLVGTLRKNRKGIPKEILSTKLKKGEIIGRQKDGIVLFKWKDKRDVLMLTTKHDETLVEVPGRINKFKPKAVVDYNKAKTFIDLSDQMSSYSTSVRRSLKWYRKVAVELITGTCVVNACYLFNKNNNKVDKKQITELRESLCLKMLAFGKKENPLDFQLQDQLKHRLIPTEKKGRCAICYKKYKDANGRVYATKNSRQVKTKCETCEEHFMCLECFFDNHISNRK